MPPIHQTPLPNRGTRAFLALIALLLCTCLAGASGCSGTSGTSGTGSAGTGSGTPAASSGLSAPAASSASSSSPSSSAPTAQSLALDLPVYQGQPRVELNGGEPGFTAEDATTEAFEEYGALDWLGRCTGAYACLGPETVSDAPRGDIREVRPTGWHTDSYAFVDGERLYNRCHLIAHQLSGEDANERNLITGTRYLNTDGMLDLEEMVGDYIRSTGNHVLYRVTPVFVGDELVARGLQMEALSMEDGGAGVRFNVYVFNVQPGVEIDYASGDNWLAEGVDPQTGRASDAAEPAVNPTVNSTGNPTSGNVAEETGYVLNTKSMRFHLPSCASVETIAASNRSDVQLSREELIDMGYVPCGSCQP